MERRSPLSSLPLDGARLCRVLTAVLDHAMPACAAVEYRLVGTAASLLHGVQLPAGDVDILVRERAAVDAFAAALSSCKCLTPPTYLEEARQYFAAYEVDGVAVEVSTVEWPTDADGLECIGPGPWEHFQRIPCGSYAVPTVALELRLVTELCRERPERSAPLLHFMQVHGCDVDLVRLGLEGRGYPAERQREVLGQLRQGGPRTECCRPDPPERTVH